MGNRLSREKPVRDDKRDLARRFRAQPTAAEEKLWQALRGRKLDGLKFRRQQPVRGFIVDFYCEALNLAVEVDGKVHEAVDIKEYDAMRQQALEAAGLQCLRVSNADVLHRLDQVLKLIVNIPKAPSPSPPWRGGGAPN